MTNKTLRIGAGAGYSGDRIGPALDLAERGNLDYLVFECLAERTIALAQQQKLLNPDMGYDPLLEARMIACLPICWKNNTTIISNMGAANPLAAAHKTAEIAKELGFQGMKIAAITGDDVFELISNEDKISANAYLGAEAVVKALQQNADVIITGRIADPALFYAPLIYEFGWDMTDYDLMGKGVLMGHLLECAGQVCGGYFADPGFKDVPDLANIGFPIAGVHEDGSFVISKLPESGGMITAATCKEQLLYEIHDPANYYTPDVIADFSNVRIRELAKDKVKVSGASGKQKSGKLKVSVGYRDSFIGEGQISYGGPGAPERGKFALEIVRKRFELTGIDDTDSRYELIGLNSLYGNTLPEREPSEVRVRVAVRTSNLADAKKIGNEVETLYTNGPAGGGGVIKSAREVIAVHSVLIDENLVSPEIHLIRI